VPHPTHKSISLPDDVVCESWSKMMRISHLSGVWRAVAAYSVLCEAGYVIIFHDQAMTEFLFSKSFTSSAVKQYSNIQQQRLRFHSRDLHCRNSSTDAASTCTVQHSTESQDVRACSDSSVPDHGTRFGTTIRDTCFTLPLPNTVHMRCSYVLGSTDFF